MRMPEDIIGVLEAFGSKCISPPGEKVERVFQYLQRLDLIEQCPHGKYRLSETGRAVIRHHRKLPAVH